MRSLTCGDLQLHGPRLRRRLLCDRAHRLGTNCRARRLASPQWRHRDFHAPRSWLVRLPGRWSQRLMRRTRRTVRSSVPDAPFPGSGGPCLTEPYHDAVRPLRNLVVSDSDQPDGSVSGLPPTFLPCRPGFSIGVRRAPFPWHDVVNLFGANWDVRLFHRGWDVRLRRQDGREALLARNLPDQATAFAKRDSRLSDLADEAESTRDWAREHRISVWFAMGRLWLSRSEPL